MRRITPIPVAIVLSAAASAQLPRVITNINPTGDARVEWITRAGDRVFFHADDGVVGAELWCIDASGPRLVRDIQPGSVGSSPREFAAVGDKLFFSAGTIAEGQELWVSDGTALGTKLVKDILPGRLASNPTHLFAFGGNVYFSANDGRAGHELWVSDGTVNGTKLVRDIWPGGGIGQDSAPRHFAAIPFTTRFVFQAHDGQNGRELWVSDGTGAGTSLVRDIRTGALGSSPAFLHGHGGKVYFHADDGQVGHELWETDGTPGGTRLVLDITPGRTGSRPSHFTNLGTAMFFRATTPQSGTELWISDGTAANTRKLIEIDPTGTGSNPSFATAVGSRRFYFSADDGNTGRELWVSDGTAAGTRLVQDTYAGKNGLSPSNTTAMRQPRFAALFGTVYFGGATAAGTELWSIDNGASAIVVPGSACIEPWSTITATDPALGSGVSLTGRFTSPTLGTLFVALPLRRPLPLFGCRLYLDPTGLVRLGDFNGTTFRIDLPLPNAPVLDGLTVRAQAVRFSGPGITLTNAVDLTLGR